MKSDAKIQLFSELSKFLSLKNHFSMWIPFALCFRLLSSPLSVLSSRCRRFTASLSSYHRLFLLLYYEDGYLRPSQLSIRLIVYSPNQLSPARTSINANTTSGDISAATHSSITPACYAASFFLGILIARSSKLAASAVSAHNVYRY